MRSFFVPLTRGLVAIIDEADAERVCNYCWSANAPSPGRHYAQAMTETGLVYLHRFIMKATPDQLIDHRNRETLDCRRRNLRIATPRQNSANSARRPNRTGFRGVDFVEGKWFRAKIGYGGRKITIGRYPDPVSAARAYDARAHELFGEFAVLNFPIRSMRPKPLYEEVR